MAHPYTRHSDYRWANEAMMNFFRSLRMDYGTLEGLFSTPKDNTPLIVVYARPARVAATITKLLVERGWITKAQSENPNIAAKLKSLPVPAASFYRTGSSVDFSRSRVSQVVQYAEQNTSGENIIAPMTAYRDLSYEVTFWSQLENNMDFMLEWYESRWGTLGASSDEAMIEATYPEPFGTLLLPLKTQGLSDAGELEGDDAPIIRWTANLSLKAPIFKARLN